MPAFAQKQQPQKPVSSSLPRANMATPRPDHCEPIRLQRATGHQEAQRMLQANAEDRKAGLAGTASPRFGHDFSQIPVHPPAAGAIQAKFAINRPGDECSPGKPQDAEMRAFMGLRFGDDFSRVRVHAKDQAAPSARAKPAPAYSGQRNIGSQDGRFPATSLKGDVDRRPGSGFEDPVHQPMLDAFREQQSQPPGGIDDQGNQVGPTDAEIKYRPQPIAVLNGPFHAPIDTPTTVGMEIQITVQSSSGNNADMASAQDSEQVGTSFEHTGSCATMPAFSSSNSDFMPAVNIPNDRHGSGRAMITERADNHGGSGSYHRQQLDIYTHARHGILNPIAIPNSGYRITRTITAGPGTQIRFRVDKRPEACTVHGFSTTAGPSPAQHDEVIVRP